MVGTCGAGVDTNVIRTIWDRGRSAGASVLSIVSRGNCPKSAADSLLEMFGSLACGLRSVYNTIRYDTVD